MATTKKPVSSPAASPSGKRMKTGGDDNMADAITQALAKQQDVMANLVKEAMVGIHEAIGALRSEMAIHTTSIKEVLDKVDRIQAETRGLKRDVINNKSEVEKLKRAMASLEDRERRNNIRLVNLSSNREGSDAVGFLQKMLPKWFPLLGAEPIQIERAHRIYSQSTKNGKGPRTLIFKVLRYKDRQAILQGAREAKKNNKPIQDNGKELMFFADYSNYTAQKRKAYGTVQKELRARGIPSFLIYPAILRVTHNGQQLSFGTAEEAEAFCKPLMEDNEAQQGAQSRRKLVFTEREPSEDME